jgi:hypothetical protein
MSRLPTHRAGFSRYPDNLSEQDQLTYWRWVRGMFVVYSMAIGVAVAASFASRPTADLTASIESARQLTAANSRPGFGTSVAAEKR